MHQVSSRPKQSGNMLSEVCKRAAQCIAGCCRDNDHRVCLCSHAELCVQMSFMQSHKRVAIWACSQHVLVML